MEYKNQLEAIEHEKINELIKDFSEKRNKFEQEYNNVRTNPTYFDTSTIKKLNETNLALKKEGENLEKMKTTLNKKFDGLKPIEYAVLDLENQAKDLKTQYDLLESEMDELKKVIYTSDHNITELANQIKEINENINTINEVQTELLNNLETDLNTKIDKYNIEAKQQKRSIILYGFTVEDLPSDTS